MGAAAEKNNIVNAMSVDVEDYFQVSAFEDHIKRSDWNELPCRVSANMERVLELFADKNVHATFFVLGWIAERYPEIVRNIVAAGHELASHGYDHRRVTQLDRKKFTDDVTRTKKLLEDLSGTGVSGYRAPSYSINGSNLWALDALLETGHKYSSSIYPIKHDLYGMPEAPRFPFHHNGGGLVEIPVSTVQVFARQLPCGGGGYFRLAPYWLSKLAIQRVNESERQSTIFYFHPWEIDPDQPRQQVSAKARFRHYVNLRRMQGKLAALLSDFSWNRVDSVYREYLN